MLRLRHGVVKTQTGNNSASTADRGHGLAHLMRQRRNHLSEFVQARNMDQFRTHYKTECANANVDYVPMDTSVSFDKALLQYMLQRQRRF